MDTCHNRSTNNHDNRSTNDNNHDRSTYYNNRNSNNHNRSPYNNHNRSTNDHDDHRNDHNRTADNNHNRSTNDDDDKHTAFYPAGSSAVMDGQFPSCHAPTSCGAKCSKVVDDALSKCVTWVDADQPSGTVREACASTLDHAKKTCEDELPGQVQTCYRAAAAGFQALLSGESE